MEPVRLRSRLMAAGLDLFGPLRWRECAIAGATVLAYHGVVEHTEDPVLDRFSVDVRTFRSHLELLSRCYRPVPLTRIVARLKEGGDMPPEWVAVTMDDGLASQSRLAAPLLREFDIPWAWSIPAGIVDTDRAVWTYELSFLVMRHWRWREFPPLPGQKSVWPTRTRRERVRACQGIKGHLAANCTPSERRDFCAARIADVGTVRFKEALRRYGRFASASWSDVRTCVQEGVELLSHGWDHEHQNGRMDAPASRRELVESRRRIGQMTGQTPEGFAFPGGCIAHGVTDALIGAGYTFAVTSEPVRVCAGCEPFEVPRLNAEYPLCILRRQLSRKPVCS